MTFECTDCGRVEHRPPSPAELRFGPAVVSGLCPVCEEREQACEEQGVAVYKTKGEH